MSVHADMREAPTGGAERRTTLSRAQSAAVLPSATRMKSASGSQSFQNPRVMTLTMPPTAWVP